MNQINKVTIVFWLMLLTACVSAPQYDFVPANPYYQRLVIRELIGICTEYYPKETVFNLQTNQTVSQWFEKEMRSRGYAFSHDGGKKIFIVVDQLDKNTLYLKLSIDKTEFTKTINTEQQRYLSSNTWTKRAY